MAATSSTHVDRAYKRLWIIEVTFCRLLRCLKWLISSDRCGFEDTNFSQSHTFCNCRGIIDCGIRETLFDQPHATKGVAVNNAYERVQACLL